MSFGISEKLYITPVFQMNIYKYRIILICDIKFETDLDFPLYDCINMRKALSDALLTERTILKKRQLYGSDSLPNKDMLKHNHNVCFHFQYYVASFYLPVHTKTRYITLK